MNIKKLSFSSKNSFSLKIYKTISEVNTVIFWLKNAIFEFKNALFKFKSALFEFKNANFEFKNALFGHDHAILTKYSIDRHGLKLYKQALRFFFSVETE